ncbi:MAG: GNAT family N-acetyltransferase [Candidatus Pacebacteria bacterium]|nr:GNAT family N-acetyltransferase [Candidatus Paceibacterota bacterium]
MKFSKLTKKDFEECLTMGVILYKKYSREELWGEFYKALRSRKNAIIYICKDKEKLVGFIKLSLRNDYVEGSNSSPVGYVEGIYIDPNYRGLGLGRKLFKFGEKWSFERGCNEYAADSNFPEKESQKILSRIGFKEVNRIICYLKKIK